MIYVNTVIKLLAGLGESNTFIRVCWISPNSEELFVINITNSKKMELPYLMKMEDLKNDLKDSKAEKVEYEQDFHIINPSNEYLEKYAKKLNDKWNLIKDTVYVEPDIYFSAERMKLFQNIKNKTGAGYNVLYDLLKRYWFYGKCINGLLPNYFDSGAEGEVREYKTRPGRKGKNIKILDDKDFVNFQKAVEKFRIAEKTDIIETHQRMCEHYYPDSYYRKRGKLSPLIDETKAPSEKQFRYWYNKNYSVRERKGHSLGQRRMKKDFRALLGSNSMYIEGPGYLYQIDSTPADISLLAIDNKTPIGRPILFIVKDVFSRKVVGFNASVNHASWVEGAMMALENAVTDKVEFCKKYGVDIDPEEWDCYHLPRNIVADRGEMKSKYPNGLVGIGVDIANTPSYRPDLKGVIEQHFHITNKTIRDFFHNYGAILKDKREPGDSKPDDTAAITLDTFNIFMIEHIIAFNKMSLPREFVVSPEMFKEHVKLTPNGLWEWGTSKNLLHERPKNLIHYTLLPKMTAKVTRFGLELKANTKLCYTCKEGEEVGWFVSESIEGNKEIEVSYDPRDCSVILIRLKTGKLLYCSLTEKFNEYRGLSLDDAKAIFEFRKQEYKGLSNNNKQAKADRRAMVKPHIKADIEAKKAAKASETDKPIGKREARVQEANSRKRTDAFTNQWPEQPHEVVNKVSEIVEKAESNTQLPSENKLSEFLRGKHKEKNRSLHA
ncbi:DDE-type integrase/transposase/recombinase [Paenibacillus sp. LMG 31461]|uniref:DDE-type integrase/transposase/recombinase n=1 Tax=Paenibacillus plantarum TaxID=2654975 RepID=A0ABX1X349_9BACL|nr:transposase [Paenibacillus plantarum]NOU62815.1 DDE-type integrase/transposase/recombinase [Paenibacillus plantarum]